MFCENCGKQISENELFCENCGAKIVLGYNSKEIDASKSKLLESFSLLKKGFFLFKNISPLKVLGSLFLIFFIYYSLFVGYNFYQSYEQTQKAVLQTSRQLEDTKAKLNDIASSTAQKLTDQSKELDQKSRQITKLEADLKNTPATNMSTSNVAGDALSSLSPSVVKVICYSDLSGEDLQMGSGILYYSASGNPSTYFVETNLHVVRTSDGSTSKCAIVIYPNYRNTLNYLVYSSSNYKTYKYGVDFAYIIPQITNDSDKAGTMDQLKKYAKNLTSGTYCRSTNIGDHVSILGYPSVGGSSLTATDGIISGFEFEDGSRFIKTSAKIEHGNSGGVAIKDSGCVLGIPTYVETGDVESIGRILDLNYLFSN